MRYVVLILISILLSSCGNDTAESGEAAISPSEPIARPEAARMQQDDETEPSVEPPELTVELEKSKLTNPDGEILKERFMPPEGFTRIEGESGSFAEFLQNLPLKTDGAKVKYFDGREKSRDVYMAVVDYTLGGRDLQQCADAVMRLRAEYLYSAGKQDEIHFNFVNGFECDFSKWAEGYGVSVDGNNVSWVADNRNDGSYESLQKYLDIVYAYASTLSLEKELEQKELSELATGDVFIAGGSPGHCVIVVDTAENESTGEKVFMLAQSYMPAQDIQILNGSTEDSPWYSTDIGDKLVTPEWVFEKDKLKTWR